MGKVPTCSRVTATINLVQSQAHKRCWRVSGKSGGSTNKIYIYKSWLLFIFWIPFIMIQLTICKTFFLCSWPGWYYGFLPTGNAPLTGLSPISNPPIQQFKKKKKLICLIIYLIDIYHTDSLLIRAPYKAYLVNNAVQTFGLFYVYYFFCLLNY